MFNKIKIDHKKATHFIYILVVILVVEGFIFLSQDRNIEVPNGEATHEYDPNSPYPVPTFTVSDGSAVPIPVVGSASPYGSSINTKWPRTFYVISKSVTAPRTDGGPARVYNYGDIITVASNQQVLNENGKQTGYIIGNNEGLLLQDFYPAYQKVFAVSANSYKNLPMAIKYKLLEKAGLFCGTSVSLDTDTIQALLAGNVPSTMPYDLSNILNCSSGLSMPRSSFIAEHAIAYANLDDNSNTPDHVLVVTENAQPNGANCTGSATIFSIDAEGRYYAKDLSSLYSVCYVDKIKKGSIVKITKTVSTSDGTSKDIKEDFTIPTDSFVVHTENNGLVYLLYDKTTSTQAKYIYETQNIYDGGAD